MLAAAVGAAALYPIAGCGLFGDEEDKSQPPAPDPLAPLLAEALSLASQHEAAIAAFPALAERLTPVAAAHREHATALTKVIKAPAPSASASSASPAPPSGDEKSTLGALRSAEQKGQKSAAQACQAAAAERAALLGSIAAARATHLEVVR
ncbi:hypothetical protein GCM10022251_47260 [Phytohabitans flavus]|uniref:DUF4439 domain-containing protein n=1 Tax=Phytohabitans flavus TaxID=1076124 RepID=A0A6F8Y857_9ACTN|nr:hypothetical protein Pflav_087140 [Phytohabitans flavus]